MPGLRLSLRSRSRRRVPFNPSQVSAVSSWLRLAASTINAGEYDTIANVLVPTNPTNQVDADRKPAAGTSANGLPVMTWDGTDVLVWPRVASNNSTTQWGLMLWIKPAANISSRQRIMHCTIGTNSDRLNVDIVAGGLGIGFYNTGGSSGRAWEQFSCITPSVWQCIRVQFDGWLSGDDNVMQVFKNEVKITGPTFTDIGPHVDMTALNAGANGYLLGGGVTDQDAVIAPLLDGVLTGPNWFVLNKSPTAAQGLALMNFEAPT
jgi:hypothetical protein